ncbi:MAG TPA: 4-(cytidine 5'-diphospho)-2-C-methyl-D-erythritol kinase [Alphaproteobacteria bacterium]|nr:4-(cytidine 5'-diphospho)-2-C-methyl-D-erythritol kinase [Rhodospirillaceae bacterium]HRJ65674.1 4-(cytidine 5'-diphospho)-2-C-methyl-D-erythritol kinase [Alphaproteobacteria bacterium]
MRKMELSNMSAKTFSLHAPAKINLFLHVTGRRDDGYHLLQSIVVFAEAGDNLTFTRHDSLFIDVEGHFADRIGDVRDNLVYKAALALGREYGIAPTGQITLKKNLPVASGIGGGSSDAATTLRGLSKLWALPEEKDRLRRIGAALGADVPACLVRRPVWMEGAGEKMMALPEMPDMHLVLVTPPVSTPTPEVFARFARRFSGRYSAPIQFGGRRKTLSEWIADLRFYRNDLTDAAIEVSPDIRRALQAIESTPNCHIARLSGSGATCFGIYDNAAAAAAAVNKIRLEHPAWWVKATGLFRE